MEDIKAVTQSDNMRNRKHRKSNTGEQNIYHNKTNKNYEVCYQSLQVKTRVFFCYSPTAVSKNKYESKELAFEAALLYRDMLVDSGLIILT